MHLKEKPLNGLSGAYTPDRSANAFCAAIEDFALASFIVLAQFLGVLAQWAQIHYDSGQGDRPYTFDDLVRVANKRELIARRKRATIAELHKRPLPGSVQLKDGSGVALLKIDESGEIGMRRPNG